MGPTSSPVLERSSQTGGCPPREIPTFHSWMRGHVKRVHQNLAHHEVMEKLKANSPDPPSISAHSTVTPALQMTCRLLRKSPYVATVHLPRATAEKRIEVLQERYPSVFTAGLRGQPVPFWWFVIELFSARPSLATTWFAPPFLMNLSVCSVSIPWSTPVSGFTYSIRSHFGTRQSMSLPLSASRSLPR